MNCKPKNVREEEDRFWQKNPAGQQIRRKGRSLNKAMSEYHGIYSNISDFYGCQKWSKNATERILVHKSWRANMAGFSRKEGTRQFRKEEELKKRNCLVFAYCGLFIKDTSSPNF